MLTRSYKPSQCNANTQWLELHIEPEAQSKYWRHPQLVMTLRGECMTRNLPSSKDLICQLIHLLMALLGNWQRLRKWGLTGAISHQLGDFVWFPAPILFLSLSLPLGYCELSIFTPRCFLSHSVLPHHHLPAMELADCGLKHSNPKPR